jgi:hypothetical protein
VGDKFYFHSKCCGGHWELVWKDGQYSLECENCGARAGGSMSTPMKDEEKAWIDGASYEALLQLLRFAPVGAAIFQGESGKYYKERMAQLRGEPGGQERHVAASKDLGWERR